MILLKDSNKVRIELLHKFPVIREEIVILDLCVEIKMTLAGRSGYISP